MSKINTIRIRAVVKEIEGAKDWLNRAQESLQAFQARFTGAELYSEPAHALAAILDELKAGEEYRIRAVGALFQITAEEGELPNTVIPIDEQEEAREPGLSWHE